MNKKAWIRIVEAFIAILFIAGIALIVINNKDVNEDDFSLQIYDLELSILREIQLNDSLRDDVLSVSSVPAEWEDTQFPTSIKDKISGETPSYLECTAKICSPENDCVLDEDMNINVYAESVIITVTTEGSVYNPKKLKLFCWEK